MSLGYPYFQTQVKLILQFPYLKKQSGSKRRKTRTILEPTQPQNLWHKVKLKITVICENNVRHMAQVWKITHSIKIYSCGCFYSRWKQWRKESWKRIVQSNESINNKDRNEETIVARLGRSFHQLTTSHQRCGQSHTGTWCGRHESSEEGKKGTCYLIGFINYWNYFSDVEVWASQATTFSWK